jgi:hypothetical protein
VFTALQHGPYVTPPVIKGCRVVCGVRGVMQLVGLSSGTIPWPVGERDGERALIVYRGLARAIRSESAGAVAAAGGVPVDNVEAWRQATEDPTQAIRAARGLSQRWTPEEDAALMVAADLASFAKQHGRTESACKYRHYVLRIKQAKVADRMRKPARKKRRQ